MILKVCFSNARASLHRGKIEDWPTMSRSIDVLIDSFVFYEDLSEYFGLKIIEQGFPGEPALKKHYKT